MKFRSIICVSAIAAVASASALTSNNTFARLPVTGNTFENALISIPLAGCGEATEKIYVTNLVMTANLKSGDKLIYRNGGAFYAWTLQEDGGEWTSCAISSTKVGNSTTPEASATLLDCGEGCWLYRSAATISADPTIYLFGQVNSGTLTNVVAAGTSSAVTYTVIGLPFETGTIDLYNWKPTGVAVGDTITVPDSGTLGQKTYTYKDGNWTYQTSVESGTGKKKSYTVTDTPVSGGDVVFNAGTAFLYGRKATTPLEIVW